MNLPYGVERMRRFDSLTTLFCTLAVGCLLGTTGCSGSDTSETNGSPDASIDGSSTDEEAPSFRDVSASIQGEFSSQVDLSESATRVLPVPAMTTFTVFADDNETGAEQLGIDVIDAQGEPLADQSSTFTSGLWKISVEVRPGMEVRLRATDRAGNSATTESTLKIPSQAEALVKDWQRRTYTNDDQSIDERINLSIEGDGTWEEQRPDATLGGDYSVHGDVLRFSRTYLSSSDTNRETIERQVRSNYYVDGTYMHRSPWQRDGTADESEGVAGTWTRSYKEYTPQDGAVSLKREVTSTLTLSENSESDNTWSRTRSGTDYNGDQGSAFTSTTSGTWKVVENESYGGNFGDYLVRTKTHEDGTALESPETMSELFYTPLDLLLVSPYLDTEE
jgi:hypothetical protein